MSIFFKPEERDKSIFPHDVFKSLVVPRPIGWISSISKKGETNLAPYSFFSGCYTYPNIVSFCPEGNKDSKNFVLTPIAPHNLNARPLVISDEKEIEISINGRENEYFVSADSKIFSVSIDSKLYISKAPYFLKMVEFEEDSYINTLREKLMWGKDRRTEQ